MPDGGQILEDADAKHKDSGHIQVYTELIAQKGRYYTLYTGNFAENS